MTLFLWISPILSPFVPYLPLCPLAFPPHRFFPNSLSMVTDPEPPAAQTSAPRRVTRGAASQMGPLAKVSQMPRVQRAKARSERRHLSRNRVQRQNRVREQAPHHSVHARGPFLHQPSQRSYSHWGAWRGCCLHRGHYNPLTHTLSPPLHLLQIPTSSQAAPLKKPHPHLLYF